MTLYQRYPTSWGISIYDDWTKEEVKRNVGGIDATISWKDHNLGTGITEVLHLSRLGYLSITVPDKAFLDQFESADIVFRAAGDIHVLDLKSLKYSKLMDGFTSKYIGETAFLDGQELLNLWKLR